MVHLHVYWGNDDAESSINVGERSFQDILKGKPYTRKASGHYEGKRFPVLWSIENKFVSITGDDGMQCWEGDLASVYALDEDGKQMDLRSIMRGPAEPGPERQQGQSSLAGRDAQPG